MSQAGVGSRDDEKAHFFAPYLGAAFYSQFYRKKFLCVDKADLELYGDFN